MPNESSSESLKKNLTLFDVYAISTGAMFSSGFFLLPGLAASATGESSWLAYLAAGVLILPAMLCMAELSTAMPKAGGTYFFLDRSLGPMMGTVGGLGSWVAVVFKSAFALVGMGAYLALYFDVPITALAVVLTLVFGAINIVGAKETTLLQRFLVTTLVVILAAFVIKGMVIISLPQGPRTASGEFFRSGMVGFIGTIGLVFVSYAGLTKVASVAEEVDNPDRNIPLGMTLSLLTATIVYTLGMLVMLRVLEPDALYGSLTPVADAGRQFLDWVPYDLGVILIVVAAIAAFASTGNAGIMSASRYPFAMAKDQLVPDRFGRLGRFGTPTAAVGATVLAMVVILLLLDVESVAKLASAFQLLLFGLVSLCVIVMRESRIESYKPGYRAPFYPWLQIAGLLISFWLIVEMGLLAIGFTGMLAIACAVWYHLYASSRTSRAGAILHVSARIGNARYEGLERELMGIIHERTQDENLSYESLITRSTVLEGDSLSLDEVESSDATPSGVAGERGVARFEALVRPVAAQLSEQSGVDAERLCAAFVARAASGQALSDAVRIWYRSLDEVEQPELVVLRFRRPIRLDVPEADAIDARPRTAESDAAKVPPEPLHTLIFLVAPHGVTGLDLRLAGHLAEIVRSRPFEQEWQRATTAREHREILMRDDHFLHAPLAEIPFLAARAGESVGEIELPGSCLIALIERDGELITAGRRETLRPGDEVAIIGEPEDLERLGRAG